MTISENLKSIWKYGIRRERFTILDLVDVSDKPVVVGGVGTIGDLVRERIGPWHPAVKSPWLQLDLINEEKHPELRGRIGWAAILGIGKGWAVLPPVQEEK